MKLKKVQKNLLFIKNFKFNELSKLLYKSLYNNLNLSFFFRKYIFYKYLNNINNNLTKIRLGCYLTFRMRSKYSYFNISRIKIRDLTSLRLLTGLRKAS